MIGRDERLGAHTQADENGLEVLGHDVSLEPANS